MAPRASKPERHRRLRELLESDPFVTDRELAGRLGVSVQTIRLDRLELGIPESRERTRRVAEEATKKVRSVMTGEVIGDLVRVSLGQEGVSILEPTAEMAFKRSGIVRGHHIFAQANSLAVALVDAEVAVTGSATVRFLRPVRAGDRLVATAKVMERSGRRYRVNVVSQVGGEDVFKGEFVVFALDSSPAEVRVEVEGGSAREDRP
ncbi:MAG: transcription factor FapR [Betaproteobacteria bacterium]